LSRPSSRRRRRNSMMRSVIAASPMSRPPGRALRTRWVAGEPSRRRAVDARPFGQTRRERRLAAESHRLRGDVQVQRRRTPLAGMADADPVLGGHRLDRGNPVRTPGKRDKPLRYAGLWRGRQRRKSPVRRCFKSRPPFGGVRRFASGCRFCRAVNRPLVRIPAHRHTTTGTCDLGKAEHMHARPQIKHYFPLTPKKTASGVTGPLTPPQTRR
jgi:hypothetical protein